ncbi:endonuclease domain-containing 1 protein-like [Trachinotus anak]|uniref:endonuclease domain-containing 1 protein-like n=1 Tax=Trachinotus anak TaxID=443729 RepID=UPI0039F228B6
MYEPQLANPGANPEMQLLPTEDINVINSQAVSEDYTSNYTRGHLTPTMHQRTLEDREATFTLTNIVPQREGSNSGPWGELEKKVLNRKTFCQGDMYVITGVMPGNRQMNEKVSVPDYLWSAYCCTKYKTKIQKLRPKFPTYAAVGSNIEERPEHDPVEVKTQDFAVTQMSLADLERNLKAKLRLRTPVSLFAGGCTVTKGD